MSKKSGGAKGTGVGIIGFGVTFAALSLLFQPHSVGGYIVTALVSALLGTVVGIMGSGLDTTTHNRQPDSLQKVQTDTGNEEIDKLLSRGREMISDIRAENARIPDSGMTEKLDTLEAECAEIFSVVYEKPGKAGQIRKFMEYYLPTTLKMVKGYRTLDERGVNGTEADGAKQRIDDALSVVLTAADKLKQTLYRDDVLDLNTDIDVLKQMLKRDGLTENDLDQAVAQARQAAAIDRAAEAAQQMKRQQAEQAQSYDSGVQAAVKETVQAAEGHVSSVPTMDGGTYTVTDSGAQAQARMPE